MYANGLLITDELFYARTIPYLGITALIVIGLMLLKRRLLTRKVKQIFTISFLFYLFVVLYITVFSRNPGIWHPFDWNIFSSYSRTFHIEDGYLQYESRDAIVELVDNIILYILFGFLLTGVVRAKNYRILIVLLSGVMFSLCTEIVQYLFCLGNGELTDVLNNLIGVAIGLVLYVIAEKKLSMKGESKGKDNCQE